MAKESGESGITASPSGEVVLSAEAESKIQKNLDDTFGGVDDADRESPARPEGSSRKDRDDDGDGEKITKVREHTRKVRSRRRDDGDDEVDEGTDEDAAAQSKPQRKPKPKPDEDSAEAAQGDDLDDPTGESVEGDGEGDGVESTDDEVPAHLIEAARRRGWSEDRIQRLIKADPALAVDTFEQLHEDANQLSREFAALGRTVMAGGGQQQGGWQMPALPANNGGTFQQPGHQQQSQQQQQLLPAFEPPKELIESLDENDPHRKMYEGQSAWMKQVSHVMNNIVAAHHSFIQERQNEVLYNQIDDFFKGRKGFEKLYGDQPRTKLIAGSPEHLARTQVVQMADMIKAGAAKHGVQMTVQESLERAHNMVTSELQQQTARQGITDAVRKRNGQITARPSHKTGGERESHSKDPLAKATSTAAKKLRELNRGGGRSR